MDYIKGLEIFLAQTYGLSLKAQVYHWNAVGSHFLEDHRFYEEQYDNLSEAVDGIAERLRMLGKTVPVTLKSLASANTLGDPLTDYDRRGLLSDLLKDHQALVKEVNALIKAADDKSDEVTVDFLIDRLAFHEKSVWMIGVTLN